MSFHKNLIKTIIITTLITSLYCDEDCSDVKDNELILNTLNGEIKGKCETIYVYPAGKSSYEVSLMAWYSIPYAQPPIGKLRFKSPLPVNSWTKTRLGIEDPSPCIQNGGKEGSEDCLYLNILSPYDSYKKSVMNSNKASLLPIFVWIHGGAYVEGSAAEYDTSMISAKSNIVSVVIQYRLGVLGNFYLENTDIGGNQFLLDQNLAIKWIFDNADRFGRDKNRITIVGLSAGSNSVGYHLLMNSSWPYFKNAVLQSGTPDYDYSYHLTPKKADSVGIKVAKASGCTDSKAKENLVDCLRKVDAYQIIRIADTVTGFPIVVLKEDLFKEQPRFLYEKGKFKKCSILVGFTNYELLSDDNISKHIDVLKQGNFAAFKRLIKNEINLDDNELDKVIKFYQVPSVSKTDYYLPFVSIMSDYEYVCPTMKFAESVSIHNKDLYLYVYAHRASTSELPYADGAAHAEELIMEFGEPLFTRSDYESGEKRFSEQMIDYWTNFVVNSKPSKNDEWPRYRNDNSVAQRNLFFLKMGKIKNTIFDNRTCKFWTDLGVFNYNQ